MKKFIKLSTTKTIVLSYIAVILLGGALLTLPVMSADGQPTDFTDALFTSTSCVCVTGLVTLTTATYWSGIGQFVILLLIQTGGVGTASVLTLAYVLQKKKIGLHDRLLVADAFNLDTMQGIVNFVVRLFKSMLVIELMGAILYAFTFVPRFRLAKGIWYSVFHSVSAFCNAGIDVLGDSIMEPYSMNCFVNIITITLIILGGLGFSTLWELFQSLTGFMNKMAGNKTDRRPLSQHSKIVLNMTAVLILGGTLCYWIFERDNSRTIGNLPVHFQLLECLFQSVTTRTAGFAVFSQKYLTFPSVVITIMLMFIGGSPGGTAGGIKTTTIAVMGLETRAVIRGESDVFCFRRSVPRPAVRKAFAVFTISSAAAVIAVAVMYCFQDGSATDLVFEVFSALGTVGLSRDFTSSLDFGGKLVIIICMYLGRVGPISVAVALTGSGRKSGMHYADGNVRVG